ncbi:hypothetical protein V1527DRAFT_493512, partial [Lipomyces starkeyi]
MISEEQIRVRREANARIVGPDLAAILPVEELPWWRQGNLLRLNIFVFCSLMYASALGYDASLMNGLQSLNQWQTFMNFPVG